MNPEEISKLQYFLFSPKNPSDLYLNVHNRVYQLWKNVWEQTLQELRLPTHELANEFGRQNRIVAICHQFQPVAIHLYSHFHLGSRASQESSYLAENYPPLFFEKLKQRGIKTVMSMEYMTVHPDWRKSRGSIHIGAVLGALGLNCMKLHQLDACIAPARKDHKVHLLAHAQGGESIISDVFNHNVICDLVLLERNKVIDHPNPDISQLVKQLWSSRIEDSSGPTSHSNQSQTSIAA